MLEQALGAPGRDDAPRPAAPLRPPDGDVGAPRAGAAARPTRCATLVPDAGHLLHMPTHIDVLCGDYARVVAEQHAPRSPPTTATPRTPATSASTSSTARTTTTSASTARCSPPSGRSRWRRPARSRRCSPRSCCGSRSRRWPTGSRGSCRCACTCSCASARWDELIATPLPADPELYCVTTAMTHYARGVALRGDRAGRRGRRRARGVPRGRRTRAGVALPVQQHLPRHPRRRRARCSTASSPTARASTTTRSRSCAGRSSSTTRCPTTSRGAGCSRPATPTARCCSSRARSSSPRPSTPPTSGSTPRSAAPASTRATSGACTATTSA